MKPENIVLDKDGNIKLIDFGLSTITENNDTTVKSMCGTPEYLAPEILSYLEESCNIKKAKKNVFVL